MDEPNPTPSQSPATPGPDAIPSPEVPQSLAASDSAILSHPANPSAAFPAPTILNLHDQPVWSGPNSTTSHPSEHGVMASNWLVEKANVSTDQPLKPPPSKPPLRPPASARAPVERAQPAKKKRRKGKPPAPRHKNRSAKKNSASAKRPSGKHKTDNWPPYRIHLRGTLAKDGERVAIVSNGARSVTIDLKLNQFLVLFVAGSFARHESKLDAPLEVSGDEYLRPSRIEQEIAKFKRSHPELEGRAEDLTNQDIYQAWYGARKRFAKSKVKHLLRARRRSGYQLRVKPHWITITLVEEKGSRTWGEKRRA